MNTYVSEYLNSGYPVKSETLSTATTRIFTFWSKDVACRFAKDYLRRTKGAPLHVLGAFPSGDVVCVNNEGTIFVALHENEWEVLESKVLFRELMDRLSQRDSDLEEDVYTLGYEEGPDAEDA